MNLVLAALLAAAPAPLPGHMQLEVPRNLRNWAPSCQRLHLEVRKCEIGQRTCNQHRVDYWRKRCQHDEPHGE